MAKDEKKPLKKDPAKVEKKPQKPLTKHEKLF